MLGDGNTFSTPFPLLHPSSRDQKAHIRISSTSTVRVRQPGHQQASPRKIAAKRLEGSYVIRGEDMQTSVSREHQFDQTI